MSSGITKSRPFMAAINGIPRRLPTAQTERQYNSKAKVKSNLLARVWWDKE